MGGREAGSREAGGPEARAYEESAYEGTGPEGTGPEGTCGPGRGPGAGREARRPGGWAEEAGSADAHAAPAVLGLNRAAPGEPRTSTAVVVVAAAGR